MEMTGRMPEWKANLVSVIMPAHNSQALLDSRVMLKHYSAEALFSPAARAAYLEPNLAAIPQ